MEQRIDIDCHCFPPVLELYLFEEQVRLVGGTVYEDITGPGTRLQFVLQVP